MQYLEWQLRDIANMIAGLNKTFPTADSGVDMAYPDGYHWGDGFRAVAVPGRIPVHDDSDTLYNNGQGTPLGWLVQTDFQWEFEPYTKEDADE